MTKSKPVGPDPMAGWSLLHKATFHGDHKLVKRLLTGGIDKNSTTPGGSAMSMGGNTAVNFAALAGHYAICRTLVGAGAGEWGCSAVASLSPSRRRRPCVAVAVAVAPPT